MTPFFLLINSAATVLSAVAGALPGARVWLRVLRAFLIIVSALVAVQLFVVSFVTWCFTYHDMPRTVSETLRPLCWLFLIFAVVGAGFCLGRRFRFHCLQQPAL